MSDDQAKIDALIAQLEWLMQRQDSISKETAAIHDELKKLKEGSLSSKTDDELVAKTDEPAPSQEIKVIEEKVPAAEASPARNVPPSMPDGSTKPPSDRTKNPSAIKADFEKFIGENLINKIGIAILIIGVAIGAKYSIEQISSAHLRE